jgi:hypothetical protein
LVAAANAGSGVTNTETAAQYNTDLAAGDRNGSSLTVKIPTVCSAGICVEGVNSSNVARGASIIGARNNLWDYRLQPLSHFSFET